MECNYYENIAIELVASFVATAITIFIGFFFVKKSLFQRFQKYSKVRDATVEINSYISGSKTIVTDFRRRAIDKLTTENQQTLAIWLDSEFEQILQQLDNAKARTDNLSGSIDTIERAGEDLK